MDKQPGRILRYDPREGHYCTHNDLKIIDYKEADEELYHKYLNGQPGEIFDEYNPATDIVVHNHQDGLDKVFLQLKRVGAYDGLEMSLPNGFYEVQIKWENAFLSPLSVNNQSYIEIGQAASFVIDDMKWFFEQRSDWNRQHQRSVLLYGPPGNGKTLAINHVAHQVVEQHDGCVLMVRDSRFDWVSEYREVLSDRNCVIVIEEITEYDKEAQVELLDFLDGQLSWPYTYVAATTNYPSELAENLGSRPGRLDTIKPVPNPEAEQRAKFLKKRLNGTPNETLVEQTQGFSYAYLNELAVRIEQYDIKPTAALQSLKEHKQRFEDGFEGGTDPDEEPLGFNVNGNGYEPTTPAPIHTEDNQ